MKMVEKEGVQTVQTRNFIFDNDDNLLEERDANNSVVKRFYDGGVQVVSGTAPGNYTYLTDHLGSVRSVLDAAGNVVAEYDYDLWGNRKQLSGSFVADIGYTADFTHLPSGLNLTLYRAYSPILGRWISRDPLEEIDGPNIYAYVWNNPVMNYDETGGSGCPVPAYLGPAAVEGGKLVAAGSAGETLAAIAVGGAAIGGFLAIDILHHEDANNPRPGSEQDQINKINAAIDQMRADDQTGIGCDAKNGEHTKNARPSTKGKHEKGKARKGRDKGGEKGDQRRPWNKHGRK